jgi:drug/metabolite transporter (DMT)-like permease
MDLRRLRAGEWIVGAAGLVLLVSLFLSWYDGQSGWESLGILDVILAFVALNALAIPLVTASYRVPALPLAHQSLTVLIGSLALLLVVGRVLNIPDWAEGREGGLWVGLLATLGVVAGGLLAMRDERRSPPGEHTDLTGVPVSEPPQIETLPAPRPE